jgi:hypothetical protein
MSRTKIGKWWGGLSRRALIIGGAVVLLLVVSAVVVIASDYQIDLRIPGNVVEYHDAVFIQVDNPESSAGTGNFNPFLQIKKSSFPVVMGYNTDADPQF